MKLDHAELLKLWLAQHKRVTKLNDIQRNLDALMAHYKLECIQKSSKSIATLSLINDAVTEMELLLAQDLSFDESVFTTGDSPAVNPVEAQNSMPVTQATNNLDSSRTYSLEEKLALLNACGQVESTVATKPACQPSQTQRINPADDLSLHTSQEF
ncbi:hypothetical protein [Shewanella aestuarii]|uniref:Uncharacterized protein n=1 Tax=Shewanella aestuarii TaxID=1028752 RepID=A0A6G9QR24_9GAMM|nr:hypothetical protein [Shewanella aestuarii]QIR16553.1 hypothetical protein HBH39_18940 [Shewanella aestuarii]